MAKGNSTPESSPKNQNKRRVRSRPVNQSPPQPTTKLQTSVPPPQSNRIMCRYIAGQSIREIAREESRDRATVTKIFRSEEMNTFVHRMRERLYGLGCDALAAVEHELRVRRNGRLGYQLLTDIGAVPPPQEKLEIGCQTVKIDRAELTPFEIAMADDENGNVSHVAYGAACAIEESAANYGFPYRHRKKFTIVAELPVSLTKSQVVGFTKCV